MMIDFNTIPYVVAFAIAMSFSNMMMNMSSLLEVTGVKKHGLMLSSVLSFILTFSVICVGVFDILQGDIS